MTGAARMMGKVDDRRRPVIKLQVVSTSGMPGATLTTLVDTGFNGQVLVEGERADHLQHFPQNYFEDVEAVGGEVPVAVSVTSVVWFGDSIEVEVFISLRSVRERRHQPTDPVLIIGTALLSGLILNIDFLERTVIISRG